MLYTPDTTSPVDGEHISYDSTTNRVEVGMAPCHPRDKLRGSSIDVFAVEVRLKVQLLIDHIARGRLKTLSESSEGA